MATYNLSGTHLRPTRGIRIGEKKAHLHAAIEGKSIVFCKKLGNGEKFADYSAFYFLNII
ncbi:hypothetical protein CJ232_11470 [Hoylesella timonensis]|uniref:Uncharacterized protein n=1 Tax=Hoylesella timonensis TaxID=386414 RepID=A0A2N6Q2Y7_9BACT|nr:hypothetical protein CJ232_11470 [Hoylesella timonensis]